MSHSFYYDNAAYTFTTKPAPTWANNIDSLMRLTQRNLIGSERGSAQQEEERTYRSISHAHPPCVDREALSSSRTYASKPANEDQAYVPRAQPSELASSYIKPYDAYELDIKTQLSTAKDTLLYLQKRIEAEVENKLAAKEKSWEDIRSQIRGLKEADETLATQLARATKGRESKLDEMTRKIDDLGLRLYDFATKKDLKASEAQLTSLFDAKLLMVSKDNAQRVLEVQNMDEKGREELREELEELRKKLRNIEPLKDDFDSKFSKHETMFKDMKREHSDKLDSLKEMMEGLKKEMGANRAATEKQIRERDTEIEVINEKYELLAKEKDALENEVKGMKQDGEKMMEKMEELLKKRMAEHDAKRAEEQKQRDKSWEDRMAEVSQLQGDFAATLEELKEKAKMTEEDAKAKEEEAKSKEAERGELDERLAKMEKELAEVRENLQLVVGSEETQKKLEEFEAKIKAIEEDLKKRQEMFQKYDDQMKGYESRYADIEQKYKKSIDELNERCQAIEEDAEGTRKTVDQQGNAHQELVARVEELEKKLQGLRLEIFVKLKECAKELQTQREVLRSQHKSQPKEVRHVGLNVVAEKQMNTVLVGTDLVSYEIEVQTESLPPVAEPAEEKHELVETLVVQDTKEPAVRETSSVYNEGEKAVSEHVSEEESDVPNLNTLIQKTPRRASLESPKPPAEEVKDDNANSEYAGRRANTVFGDSSQQTDRQYDEVTESRKNMSLRVPIGSMSLLSGSPHYLREDPLRSKDKKRIISTQGATVEENISTKNFRKAEKFTVDLDSIAKIDEEEAPRATYADVVDYNSINFENYHPQAEEESVPASFRASPETAKVVEERLTKSAKAPSGSPAVRSNEFSARSGKEQQLEALPEVVESPMAESPNTKPVAPAICVKTPGGAAYREEFPKPDPLDEQAKKDTVPVETNKGGDGTVSDDDIHEAHKMLSSPEKEEEEEGEKKEEKKEEEGSEQFYEARGGSPSAHENVEETEKAKPTSENVGPDSPENVARDNDQKEIENFVIRSVGQMEQRDDAAYRQTHNLRDATQGRGAAAQDSLQDKFKKILEINKQSMSIYERDRKQTKEQSNKLFSDKGYVVGPSEHTQNEDFQESASELSNREVVKRESVESKKEGEQEAAVDESVTDKEPAEGEIKKDEGADFDVDFTQET